MSGPQSRKILIVEDDTTLSTLYSIKFEKEGYTVKIATNGMDAVSHVMEFTPDVILLDIMMPSMDGFETLRVIRELAPSLHTKIVMFTNLNRPEDIDRCMKSGADAFLLKADTTPSDAVKKIEELFVSTVSTAGVSASPSSPTGTPPVQESQPTILCTCPNCGTKFDQKIPM